MTYIAEDGPNDTDKESYVERVKFITHEGKEILFLDFSSCKAEEVLDVIAEARKVIRSHPHNSLLTLSNVTETRFNESVSDAMKEFTAHNKPYVKAAAVIGIAGLKKIIFEAVTAFSKRKIHAFESIEEAKNWLAEN